jgi:hypothetical protein
MSASASAAAVFIVMMTVTSAAFFVSAAAASTAFTSAAASITAHHVEQAFDFFVGSRTHFDDGSFESQVLACVRVVQIQYDFVFCDFTDIGIEMISFISS